MAGWTLVQYHAPDQHPMVSPPKTLMERTMPVSGKPAGNPAANGADDSQYATPPARQ
jgi:hypothetical protein